MTMLQTSAEPGIGESDSFILLPTRLVTLQRLIAHLEDGDLRGPRQVSLRPEMDSLALLARLRQAHARYALGSGPMERLGKGAWFRHH
jgi:hypothetical protein